MISLLKVPTVWHLRGLSGGLGCQSQTLDGQAVTDKPGITDVDKMKRSEMSDTATKDRYRYMSPETLLWQHILS